MKAPSLLPLTALLLAAACTFLPLSAQELDYGNLVSLWRFNGNAADNYGPHNGTWMGTEAYAPGPKADTQAAALNGASAIGFGQNIAFDQDTAFSATAWIRGAVQDSAILGRMQHGGAYTGWELHVGTSLNPNGPGCLNLWLINAFGSSYIQVNSAVNILDEQWHHVAFTYDGSGVAAGVRLYVDGQDATGDASADGLAGGIIAEGIDLALGTRMGGAAHTFRGDLHEVSVWRSALTPQDITAIQTQGVRPPVLISSFSSSATAIFAGTPVTLSWEVDPGATVSIDQGVGDVTTLTSNGKGSIAVTREAATTYTLTATLAGRTETRQVLVDLLPLIKQFVADRSQVLQGTKIKFMWVAHPGATLSLSPEPGDVSAHTVDGVGGVEVLPTQSATYTLRAQRGGASLEAQVAITVIATQPLDFAELVSLWRLQNNTVDGYGANNGVFVGQANYTNGPRPEMTAAYLDGASYINAGQGVAFDTGAPFSATAWVKGPTAQDSTLLGRMRQGGGFTGWELHAGTPAGGSGAGRLNVWLINSFGASHVQVNSPAIALDDAWHHVACTYDGSGTAAGVKIYVDGIDATGEATSDTLSDTFLADDAELNLGSRQNGANHNFRGAMAEVSVWKSALSAGQIAHVYAFGVQPPVLIEAFVAEPSLVFAGTPATLSWATVPGVTLRLDPGIGDVTGLTTDGHGSFPVSPETETLYTLTAQQGARIETRQVTVGLKPLIEEFMASRQQIPRGSKVGLAWTVHPQAQVSITPQPGDVSGQTVGGRGNIELTPTETTLYTLRVERGGSSLEAQVEVGVVEAPPVQAPDLGTLVSLWRLDGDATDARGANPGTFMPTAAYGPGPNLDTQAAVFGGSSYVKAGQGIAFDRNDAFSVTAWLKGPAGQDSALVGRMRQGGGYTGWEFHVGGAGTGLLNVWMITAFGSAYIDVRSPLPVLDNTWHHVAFTYDGSASAAGLRIYVDGVDNTGDVAADSLGTTMVPADAELNLGSRQSGVNHNLRGSLADVAIWRGALTAENVADVYVNGIRFNPPPTVRLTGARFQAPDRFQFDWDSTVGRTYRVESSTNLRDWTVVAESYPTGGATGTTTTYEQVGAPAGATFYRVVTLP